MLEKERDEEKINRRNLKFTGTKNSKPEFCLKCGTRCEYSTSCNGCLNPQCNGPGQFG